MNRKGFTLIEALASLCITAIIVLLLAHLLVAINNLSKNNYASDDEISRAEIIKNIEGDFLEYKLRGLNIQEYQDRTEIVLNFLNHDSKRIIIKDKELVYDEKALLESKNATYDICVSYEYQELDDNYYMLKVVIPVLISKQNTTSNDDIVLSYIGLKSGLDNYLVNYTCSK